MTNNTQQNVTLIRQDYAWHSADDCLNGLRQNKVCMQDAEFRKLLGALERYIDEKTAVPNGATVTDMYVMLEVETVDNMK